MNPDEAAREIAEVLERTLIPDDVPVDGTPVLKGFFVVGEFDAVGEGTGGVWQEGLWTLSGTPTGNAPTPWRVKGWLHECLFGTGGEETDE